MRGSTFNLEVRRNPVVVRREVTQLLAKTDLDYLAMQETTDYIKALRSIKNYTLYTGKSDNGGAETEVAILVKNEHKVTKVKNKAFGDGWTGVKWGSVRMKPRTFLSLIINDEHKVAVLHYPPNIELTKGTPKDRYQDYVALSRRMVRFLRSPSRYTRTVCMDGNWPASSFTKYSPRWVAYQTAATLVSPDQKIDYVIVKGHKIKSMKKLLHFNERSDHNPVVFETS